MILIVVKQKVKAEHADAWPSLMAELTAATRAEEGNISFDWFRSPEDPQEWLLVEVFRDGAAGEAHVQTEHFQKATTVLPTLLAATPQIIHIQDEGDGWARMAEVQIED